MASLKELLELIKSDNYERDFQDLRNLVLPLMNQLAIENASLKKQLEDTTPLAAGSQVDWPEGLTPHPSNSQVPVRNNGRNGRTWLHYQTKLNSAYLLDEVREIIIEMFEQGFLDTDVLDALFSTVDNKRRLSLHNYNGLVKTTTKV